VHLGEGMLAPMTGLPPRGLAWLTAAGPEVGEATAATVPEFTYRLPA
jgi:hypothetical protein